MMLVYAYLNPRLSLSDLQDLSARSIEAKRECIDEFEKSIKAVDPQYRIETMIRAIPALTIALSLL